MLEETKDWYAVSAYKGTMLRCAFCKNEFDLEFPSLDHHARVCPVCGIECVFLDWKGLIVQIVMKNAPAVLVHALSWAQEHLDELEYVELLCALEELSDAATITGHGTGFTPEPVIAPDSPPTMLLRNERRIKAGYDAETGTTRDLDDADQSVAKSG